jgi:hypothetical protein
MNYNFLVGCLPPFLPSFVPFSPYFYQDRLPQGPEELERGHYKMIKLYWLIFLNDIFHTFTISLKLLEIAYFE